MARPIPTSWPRPRGLRWPGPCSRPRRPRTGGAVGRRTAQCAWLGARRAVDRGRRHRAGTRRAVRARARHVPRHGVLTTDFTGAGRAGDWVEARAKLRRSGRRPSFACCQHDHAVDRRDRRGVRPELPRGAARDRHRGRRRVPDLWRDPAPDPRRDRPGCGGRPGDDGDRGSAQLRARGRRPRASGTPT